MTNFSEAIRREGFAVVPSAVEDETLTTILRSLAAVNSGGGVRRRGGIYAIRNLFAVVPRVRELCQSVAVRALVEPLLGKSCFPVRGILFDKTLEAPWKVAWHQDLSIAVRERLEVEGFGRWSEKAGVVHVQPPVKILEGVLTLRLHLDDCDESNGPLRVMPGSHLAGRLNEEEIQSWRRRVSPATCLVPRGGGLLMKPLLLHSSSSPRTPRHRRVIHLEFAAEPLPGGLVWHD